MYLNQIQKQKWKISKNLKTNKNSTTSIGLLEQELHINRLRCGMEDGSKPEILIDCSDQTMITELSKSEFFTVERILISTNQRSKNLILEVKGRLELSGLTIRKKKHIFTEEEKKIRSDRAKKNLNSKR